MERLRIILSAVLKASFVLLLLNELRGIALAVPVLVGIYHSGGSAMAIWIGICSLAGIALSVIVPVFVARKLSQKLAVSRA